MEKSLEIEVKLACDDLDLIRKAGFELKMVRPRHFEDNWLLDAEDKRMLTSGGALRVRFLDGRGVVTYKGVCEETAHSPLKVREEIETETSDPYLMVQIFDRIGFRPAFRYQKYRTVYSVEIEGDEIEVVFDETPMGNFIEIEGDEKRVLRALEAAGFSTDEVIRESYPELQAARCRKLGVPLEDLIFGH